jgi:hypothetical protein
MRDGEDLDFLNCLHAQVAITTSFPNNILQCADVSAYQIMTDKQLA